MCLQPEHLLTHDTIITAQNLHRAVFIPGSQMSRRCPTKTWWRVKMTVFYRITFTNMEFNHHYQPKNQITENDLYKVIFHSLTQSDVMSFGFICWNKRALTRSQVILLISTGAISICSYEVIYRYLSQVSNSFTLKPGLAFPQNLASSETLAWHFWLGLRFGLFKNVGLKLKKRVLFILSQIFFIEFLLLS